MSHVRTPRPDCILLRVRSKSVPKTVGSGTRFQAVGALKESSACGAVRMGLFGTTTFPGGDQ
jgi:hypothetical protein